MLRRARSTQAIQPVAPRRLHAMLFEDTPRIYRK